MTARNAGDVVIVGGGIAGISTAYFLAKAGVESVVVERDSVGSHASGFAYGGLGPLGGSGAKDADSALSYLGARIHRDLSQSLPEETGVNTEYRLRPSLQLLFTEQEVSAARAAVRLQREVEGRTVRWLEPYEARAVEPRISPDALGAVYTEVTADVEPYRFLLALAQAAEGLGASIRHGRVVGLKRDGGGVGAVLLESGEVPCRSVVVAAGPWSAEASDWLDVPIDVRPLKGQILRLRTGGPPFRCSIGWAGNYATTKPDGLLWAGTTEEEAGFDETATSAARESITANLLKMVPSLTDAEVVQQQTACLRPVSGDGLVVLGGVPGWERVYVATGAGRRGILLGPAMGRVIADLITTGSTDTPIEPFAPDRFSR